MGIFLKRKYFFNLNNNVLFFQFECYFLRQYDKAIVTRPVWVIYSYLIHRSKPLKMRFDSFTHCFFYSLYLSNDSDNKMDRPSLNYLCVSLAQVPKSHYLVIKNASNMIIILFLLILNLKVMFGKMYIL